jgi:hypothetical protein
VLRVQKTSIFCVDSSQESVKRTFNSKNSPLVVPRGWKRKMCWVNLLGFVHLMLKSLSSQSVVQDILIPSIPSTIFISKVTSNDVPYGVGRKKSSHMMSCLKLDDFH